MSGQLQQKAIDLLGVAALEIGSEERIDRIEELAKTYSWKAIDRKMEELVDRGYVERLKAGIAAGGLTEKGRAALAQAPSA